MHSASLLMLSAGAHQGLEHKQESTRTFWSFCHGTKRRKIPGPHFFSFFLSTLTPFLGGRLSCCFKCELDAPAPSASCRTVLCLAQLAGVTHTHLGYTSVCRHQLPQQHLCMCCMHSRCAWSTTKCTPNFLFQLRKRKCQVAVRVGYRETEQGKEANGKAVHLRKEQGNGSLRHPEIYKRAKKWLPAIQV